MQSVRGERLGFCGRKRFVRAAMALLPVLLFLAGIAHTETLNAAARPVTLRPDSCSCSADFNRGGFADRTSFAVHPRSVHVPLFLSERRDPLSLDAEQAVRNVLAFDVDQDGDSDLIVLRQDFRLRIWLNNGRGEFIRGDQPELNISAGSKLLARESPQAGSCCCSSVYDDDASLAEAVGILFIGPELLESHRSELAELRSVNPFIESIHPRGPPSLVGLPSH